MKIRDWLARLDLETYARSFEKHHVGLSELPDLTDADLRKELGVKSLGHRKRILRAARALDNKAAAVAEAGVPGLDIEQIPSVLAVPLKELIEQRHPVLALWGICDLVELYLRLVVMVSAADLVRLEGSVPGRLTRQLAPIIDTPTMAGWYRMARLCAKELADRDPLVPEGLVFITDRLSQLFGKRKTKDPYRAATSLLALRNRLAHGGGITVARAERLLARWQPRMFSLVGELTWLSELAMIVRREDGSLGELRGPEARLCPLDPNDPETAVVAGEAIEHGAEVLLLRDHEALQLWPLAVYGRPTPPGPDSRQARQAVAQVYVRRSESHMLFTPLGSAEVSQSVGDPTALAAFIDFLNTRKSAERAEDFAVSGFDLDIRRDAAQLVGRSAELAHIRDVIASNTDGVLWLSGAAGVGKSFLLACVAADMLDDPPADTLVLPFRFKSGDARCSRTSFLRFAAERLARWLGTVAPTALPDLQSPPGALLTSVRSLLGDLGGRRVIFILDGLDEISERDENFATDIPLGIGGAGILWLCAGRPERGLPQAFSDERCVALFPSGVPPMLPADIHEMILEKIGPLRSRLIPNDKEDGEHILNPFVREVIRKAEGLPIYVRYVIGDVIAGRYEALDDSAPLPPSVSAYHEELLHRCRVGSLHQVLTPITCTLASAMEPLTTQLLHLVMARRTLLNDTAGDERVLREALAALDTLLRRGPTPEGEEGYGLFHHSFRQHINLSDRTHSAIVTARNAMRDLCRDWLELPGYAAAYAQRNLGHHFLAAGDATGLLGRIEVLRGVQFAAIRPGVLDAVVARLPLLRERSADSVDRLEEIETAAERLLIEHLGQTDSSVLADMMGDIFEHSFVFGGAVASACADSMEACVEQCSTGAKIQGLLRLNTFLTSGTSGDLSSRFVDRAEAIARETNHPRHSFVLALQAARRPPPEAVALCHEALRLATENSDRMGQWEALYNLSRWLKNSWLFAEAEQAADRCVGIFSSSEEPLRKVWALEKRAICRMRQGLLAAASDDLAQCEPILRRMPRSSVHVRQDEQTAWLALHTGGGETALRTLQAAVDEFEQIGRKEVVRSLCKLANGAIDTGLESSVDLNRLAERLEDAVAANRANISWHYTVWAMQTIARINRGDLQDAQLWLRKADALAESHGAAGFDLASKHYRAEIAFRTGKPGKARRIAKRAYRQAKRQKAGLQRPYIADLLAAVCSASGDIKPAGRWQSRAAKGRNVWRRSSEPESG